MAYSNPSPPERHAWSMADSVTALRIAACAILLLLPLGSAMFVAVYTLTGLTDALDGWLARKTGTASDFGARLDSVADLLFYAVLLLRLFPVLWMTLPVGIWYAVAVIVLVRLMAYAVAAIKFHRFAALHTRLNKLTGGAVFLLPYVLALSTGTKYCWAVCALALAAAAEELAIHLRSPGLQADSASSLHRKKCPPNTKKSS